MTPVDMLVVFGGYLLGSLPFAYLVAARAGVELRNAGSRNVGASNVWRLVGPGSGAVALMLDVAKGAAAVVMAETVTSSSGAVVGAGVAAVLGHIYPPWLRFRGGKGVATSLGAFMVLTPIPAAVGCAAFGIVLWRARIVAVASLTGAAALTFAVLVSNARPWAAPGAVACAMLIVHSHRTNLERLLRGTEARLERRP